MDYYKLTGESYQDALFKAKMQYGDNIFAIGHKEVKQGGLLGTNLFSRKAIELTIAIPERKDSLSSKRSSSEKVLTAALLGRSDFQQGSGKDSNKKNKNEFSNQENEREKEKNKASREDRLKQAIEKASLNMTKNMAKNDSAPKKSLSIDRDDNTLAALQALIEKDDKLVSGYVNNQNHELKNKQQNIIQDIKKSSDFRSTNEPYNDQAKRVSANRMLASIVNGERNLERDLDTGSASQNTAKESQLSLNRNIESNDISINGIAKDLSEIRSAIARLAGTQFSLANEEGYQSSLDIWERALIEKDFSSKYANALLKELRTKLTFEQLNDREAVKHKLAKILQKRIGIAGPIMKKEDRKKVAAFIGATGVGKTTTMAKIGAIYTYYENRKVAFVTIDNYRIAATEQLKRYSSIIGIMTHIVKTKSELAHVLKNEDAELILIDTSGRAPYNLEQLEEARQMIDDMPLSIDKILVASATAKRADQEAVIENFSMIGIDKLIISKLDETKSIGGTIEIADTYNKGFCYLTHGQDVPTDIEEASLQRITDLILRT